MKKIFLSLAVFLLIAGCVYAQSTTDKGYISVNTEAVEEYSPTVVKISFAVETRAKDPTIAAQMNKDASKKAIEAVKTLIDDKNGESIKTTSYYFSPEYNYKDGVKKINEYVAKNTLQAVFKNTDKTGKIISTALNNGATSVNGLEFILEDTTDNCNQLIQKAAKEAGTRADKIAESLGTSVSGVKTINAGCSTTQAHRYDVRLLNAKYDAAVSSSESDATPVEAGKTQLKAFVKAEFYIK